jgi:hypothetical protein
MPTKSTMPPPAEPEAKGLAIPPLPKGEIRGHVVRRVRVDLTARQARTLKRLYIALDLETAVLASGRPVKRTEDAIRWFLDSIADPADDPPLLPTQHELPLDV